MASGVDGTAVEYAVLRPMPLEEPPATTTSLTTPPRSAAQDTVRDAPAPLFGQVPSDALLTGRPRAAAPMTVLGLGARPEDAAGLWTRVAKVYAAQGGAEVRRLLDSAEAAAQSILLTRGVGAAYPAEMLRRVRVMKAALPSLAAERSDVQANLQPHEPSLATCWRRSHSATSRTARICTASPCAGSRTTPCSCASPTRSRASGSSGPASGTS